MSPVNRRRTRTVLIGWAVWTILITATTSFAAEPRHALVIGNGAYRNVAPLTNPVNDAADMAAKLAELGFSVIKITDADQTRMRAGVRRFAAELARGGVGLFYFAGHGLRLDGVNYLVPIGVDVKRAHDVPIQCLAAGYVLDAMESAGNALNIIILDACRNNPFRSFRGAAGGLAPMDAPPGSILAYATSPGSVASDGTGENGLYTAALLRHLDTPDQYVEDLFKRVRIDVKEASAGTQVPWESSSLTRDFQFVGGVQPAGGAKTAAPAPAKPSAPAAGRNSGPVSQSEWRQWQNVMNQKYLDILERERDPVTTDLEKSRAWGVFLTEFSTDNPYSGRDEQLRASAKERRDYWRGAAHHADPGPKANAGRPDTSNQSSPEITNDLGMTFVRIPAGTFMMGSPEDEPGRESIETLHQVTISQPFHLQTTETTGGQWAEVMGENPSRHRRSCGDDCPVESVTWDMVQEFIRKLNAMDPDADYRLPTEAEWEYAARAGSRTALANGNLEGLYCEKYPNLDRLSWYCGNSDGKVHPAAEKQPNRWGLYDMHGNVQEWCQDWYAEYPKGPVTDPEGPDSGSYRIMRGGNWYDNAYLCRSAYRYYHRTSYYDSILGFRLVREAR